jgi:hypothetical protein
MSGRPHHIKSALRAEFASASSKQQAASSKQQAASSKQQAASKIMGVHSLLSSTQPTI